MQAGRMTIGSGPSSERYWLQHVAIWFCNDLLQVARAGFPSHETIWSSRIRTPCEKPLAGCCFGDLASVFTCGGHDSELLRASGSEFRQGARGSEDCIARTMLPGCVSC